MTGCKHVTTQNLTMFCYSWLDHQKRISPASPLRSDYTVMIDVYPNSSNGLVEQGLNEALRQHRVYGPLDLYTPFCVRKEHTEIQT